MAEDKPDIDKIEEICKKIEHDFQNLDGGPVKYVAIVTPIKFGDLPPEWIEPAAMLMGFTVGTCWHPSPYELMEAAKSNLSEYGKVDSPNWRGAVLQLAARNTVGMKLSYSLRDPVAQAMAQQVTNRLLHVAVLLDASEALDIADIIRAWKRPDTK